MNDTPFGDKPDELLRALPELAKLVGIQTRISRASLKKIIASIGMKRDDDEALKKLETWSSVLQRVHTATDDTATIDIIKELITLGIPEFQAILAVDEAKGPLFTADPDELDFGQLKPGEGAHKTINATGHVDTVCIDNDLVKISFTNGLESGTASIKVQIPGASNGTSLHDDIIIKGSKGELHIPVKAQWKGNLSPIKTPVIPPPERNIPSVVCYKCNNPTLSWDGYIQGYSCSHMWCLACGPSNDNLIQVLPKHKWW